MVEYQYKTKPIAHQQKAFELSYDKPYFAYLMEMGTGKSKVAIDKAAYQFTQGLIDRVLIIAPNSVYTNWVTREIPAHLPENIPAELILWKKTKAFDKQIKAAYTNNTQLVFLAMNIEAIATKAGESIAKKFIESGSCLMIIDESTRIKTPSAVRTKNAIKLGKLTAERLILTGTPVTQSPFDVYAQFKFLHPSILGDQTYTAFKHEYGIFDRCPNFRSGGFYDQLISYKNIEKLQALIAPHSFRVTKDECLDLPEKIYQRYSVELTPKQRRHYNELKELLMTTIKDDEIITPLVLTQILRLQQICGGYMTINDMYVVEIDDTNPKLNLLMELIEDTQGKIIIWSRFKAELGAITEALRAKYGYTSTVRFWGEVSKEDREVAIDNFQTDPDCRFFVGNPQAGGIGITLTAASTVMYYSNSFSLEMRLQSEDRAHRIGQQNKVTYIDIEATNTIDAAIIDSLKLKKGLADRVLGDEIKGWL